MIEARALVPDPDDEERCVAFDRQFRTDNEYDRWLYYSPEGLAGRIVVTDNKPMPTDVMS